jgi:protoporphyrin/coproporphyrin ferrochelatase
MVDCLETLEEIGLRAKADRRELGGNDLQLIPCINDSELAVKTIVELIS